MHSQCWVTSRSANATTSLAQMRRNSDDEVAQTAMNMTSVAALKVYVPSVCCCVSWVLALIITGCLHKCGKKLYPAPFCIVFYAFGVFVSSLEVLEVNANTPIVMLEMLWQCIWEEKVTVERTETHTVAVIRKCNKAKTFLLRMLSRVVLERLQATSDTFINFEKAFDSSCWGHFI